MPGHSPHGFACAHAAARQILPALTKSGHVAKAAAAEAASAAAAADNGGDGGAAENGAAGGSPGSDGDGELVQQRSGPEREMTTGLLRKVHVATRKEDYIMLGQAAIVVTCCILIGVIVSSTTSPEWMGWAALLALLMILCSVAPIIQYFNTYVLPHRIAATSQRSACPNAAACQAACHQVHDREPHYGHVSPRRPPCVRPFSGTT